jgi:plastocyanin
VVRKRTVSIFVTSVVLSLLLVGAVGAAIVWAHHGWSLAISPTKVAATATSLPTPLPTSTPTISPTATPTDPIPTPTPLPTAVVGVTDMVIQNYAFSPRTIQVAVGTTVTWTNQDAALHTVTFDNGMANSGNLMRGQSFRYTFTTPGTFRYRCVFHPAMIATVIATG